MVRSQEAERIGAALAAAVVAHRAGGVPEDIVAPDSVERKKQAVDLAFVAAGVRFHLEHTLVQPFGNDVHLSERFSELVEPLLKELRGRVATDSQFDLWIAHDAAASIERRHVDRVRSALRDWVLTRGPNLPLPNDASSVGSSLSERPAGVPFDVTLVRDRGNEGLVFAGRFMPERLAARRQEALIAALKRKCPKLARSARPGEVTVLALEIGNFALDNTAIILKMLKSAFQDAGSEPPSLVVIVDARAYARGGDAVVDVVDAACFRDHCGPASEMWTLGRQGIARLR